MMAKSRHHAPRDIPEIPFSSPAGTPAGVEVMSLAELRRRVSEHTLARPQRPDFHHLLTLTTGGLRRVVDFDGYALRPGSWLWVRPGQVHQWGDLTRAEGTLILFQQDVLDPATATAARVDDPHAPVVTTPVAADAEAVTMAADHLSHEFQSFGHLPLELHIAALRHLLARATLAGAGLSAKEFIDRRVVLEAKRLLAHGDESAAQISDHLGFVTPSQFSKFFMQRAGRTPIDFRNEVRGRAEEPEGSAAPGRG
ncbi:helix-turn-helix domain-containing protein [Streptomyces sp. SP18BB07]|uniref:helix-turn-helix domain-containing protein n=1 Tax=Streptomyces sp. SP18BB07 TaxID=3002522 RepID=UPI002E766FD8|nr:helix-turn-helix domain-containing protein [Streptomyces sp. SP18BB07]MEE1760987.1 helix-turn-helix domain-containing protein [Streptomyces sp. SP18BB07]